MTTLSLTARRLLLLPPLLLLGAGCPASGYDNDDDDMGGGYYGDETSYVSGEVPPEDVEDPICEGAPAEPVTFFVSADDSNSQALPVWVRHLAQSGQGLSWLPSRPYEFLNYYDFDFGPQSDVSIVPQLRETEDGLSLLVAVVAPDKALDARRPLNLTLSLDQSGSMGGDGIAGMRYAMRAIAAELMDGDRVSIVSWAASKNVLLDNYFVSGPNDVSLLSIINGIGTGGGTDLEGGLARAYAIAAGNASPTTLDRVVLISDGGANLGVTSADLIAEHAEDGDTDGIYLAAIGTGALRDPMLDTITDLGRGSYLYIDSEEEANRKLRGPAFLSTLDLAAREVQLDLTLPEGLVIEVFSGEEISTNPEEVRPQHLAPNDAMLYHFALVDCLDGSEWGSRAIDMHVEWLEPFTGMPRSADLSVTLQQLLQGPTEQVLKADAILRYARLVSGENLDSDVVREARLALPNDDDIQEVSQILQQLNML